MPIVYLESIKRSNGIDYYICKKIKENGKWKHQIVKKLGKISKPEAEQKLAEYKPKYEKQRNMIDGKINNLNEYKKRHGIPYDIWDFKERGDGGDKNFHGNTSPKVIRQILLMLTKPLDFIVDPMAGSGTTIDVCKKLGRKFNAFDLYPKREEIEEHDAVQSWYLDDPADLIFIHPPYWNLVGYGNKQNDLSGTATIRDYYRLLQRALANAYESLKRNKYIVVQQGDLVQEGRFYPLCSETFQILKEVGFIPHHEIIKLAHGDTSRKKSGMLVSEYIWQKQWKISHDRVLVFKKMN